MKYTAMLVDRSGSMQMMAAGAEDGINKFIDEQREVPGCHLKLVEFDGIYAECYDGPVADFEKYKLHPRGSTALLDSIGKLISEVETAVDDAEDIFVIIVTDGHDNMSVTHSLAEIHGVITDKTQQGWNFIFMGANQDAIEAAASMGISKERALTYRADTVGNAYNSMSGLVTDTRAGVARGFTSEDRKNSS